MKLQLTILLIYAAVLVGICFFGVTKFLAWWHVAFHGCGA